VTSTLGWGLLGTAHINRRLIPAMRAARRSRVVALASRDATRADLFAREWDIPTAHASYDSLLKDAHVDAVYVPLPNALHAEWTLRALDAGKHVLCEKPLALSADDVDRVAAVASARERVVAEAFMYRHEPLTARLLEVVRNDAIGRVQMISSGFTFQQSRHDDVRLDAALGGGSLWDVGCYPVSIVQLIVDSAPVEVFGWARMAAGVDQSFTGLLRFSSDVVATIHSSFRAAYRAWLEVVGEEGVLRVENPFKPGASEDIIVHRGAEIAHVAVQGSSLLFVRQIEDFVAAALDGHQPTVSLAESRRNADTLAALYRSALLQQPVQL